MIKFRQKIFVAPMVAAAAGTIGRGLMSTLNVAGNAAMIGGVFQGIGQAKRDKEMMEQNEELARQQAKQNQQTIKALNNIAKQAAKNPETANAAANIMSQAQQVQYSAIGNAAREVGSLFKNVGKIALKDRHVLIGGTMAGIATGAAGYATDKIIQADMKRNGIKLPPKQPYQEERLYATSPSVLSNIGKTLSDSWKKNKGMITISTALATVPTAMTYMSQRENLKDQSKYTQKSYSVMGFLKNGIRGGYNSIKSGVKTFLDHPVKSTLGGMSVMTGGGGQKAVEGFGRKLRYLGKTSNSKLTEKTGDFIVNHPKTALIGSIPVGLGIMATTWDAGERITSNMARKFDDNAYRYQDYQSQMI